MENSGKHEKGFRELKTKISNYYRGYRYKWLRCCLYGLVPGAELDRTDVAANLFNALELQGDISPTDVGLLSEITELTCVRGAIDCVNKFKQDNKVEDLESSRLTPYRRGLVKALMNAGRDDFNNVVANYGELSSFSFSDLWDAVLKMEKANLLEDNQDKIEFFVNLLERTTKALFLAEISTPGTQQSASGTSASSSPVTLRYTSRTSASPVTQQDEKIRSYLLEQQKLQCSNYNRFTPPIMQSRFQVDIAHMFTDLDLLKEDRNGRQNAKPIELNEVLDVIKSKPSCKVLIEGEGGIGKTTLLRHLAYNWSTEKSDNPFKGKIVFLVNIREIKEGVDILDLITKNIDLNDFNLMTELPEDQRLIKRFIRKHNEEIVLMLDGLDELEKGTESPISLFKKQKLPQSLVILTSRSENINEFINLSDVHLRVKGFNKERLEEYIMKYFDSDQEFGDLLVKTLQSYRHSNLLSICRNPMLLLLTCIMWEEKKEIPSNKTDLFCEVFRCILNQYNKDESKPKIATFEEIPKQYVRAMCLLGQCMYHGLKKNQLLINKKDLIADEDVVLIALKLGFVYKDESFLKTNFQEIYAAPHKLILESLVGFYLCKIFESTDGDRPSNFLFHDTEWEEIRESDQFQNVREFAIGFLGSNADKFLKNWITNSLSSFRVLSIHLDLIKQKHVGSVVKSLAEYTTSANLEIKQYIPDVCRSLRLFILYLNPDANVTEDDDNILLLIRKVYNTERIHIEKFSKQLSTKMTGKMLAHTSVAITEQNIVLEFVDEHLCEEEVKCFIAECEKLHIEYDLTSYTLTSGTNTSFLFYLFTHSRNLEILLFRLQRNIICNFRKIMNIFSSKRIQLKLRSIKMYYNNLRNIDGISLASLMGISPELNDLTMRNCDLTGDVINDMMSVCSSRCIKFELLTYLNISDNNFSNIDGRSLASLIGISPKLINLSMYNCNLTGDVINDMMTDCSSRGIKFESLTHLNISDNNFSNIDGRSLASLMGLSPKLYHLDLCNCNLSGDVINDMMTDCSSRGINLSCEFVSPWLQH